MNYKDVETNSLHVSMNITSIHNMYLIQDQEEVIDLVQRMNVLFLLEILIHWDLRLHMYLHL